MKDKIVVVDFHDGTWKRERCLNFTGAGIVLQYECGGYKEKTFYPMHLIKKVSFP